MLTEKNTPHNTVLQFSGGKDSLCLLNVMKPFWNQLTVLWVNTGAAYPETIALMERIRKMVPHFFELKTNQPESIKRSGYPVDVVPIRFSVPGHSFEPGDRIKIRPYLSCCGENIWWPLEAYCKEKGFTTVIRGQRHDERMRTPIPHGHVEDGVTYLFPIEQWTEGDVFHYLHKNDIEIPAHYAVTKTSLDCWSCTAFLHESGVHKWLKTKHPEKHKESQSRLRQIKAAIESEMAYLNAVLD
jgi:3'-phosphoadenosine 5'-phosphosulfate sulfotransferase (PAPS reductase)/FAD synthetase